MARHATMETETTTTAHDEEDIEAELFFSAREAGVACFAVVDVDADEGVPTA